MFVKFGQEISQRVNLGLVPLFKFKILVPWNVQNQVSAIYKCSFERWTNFQ